MSGESRVPAAGVGAFRIYVWLVLASPVLLLVAAIMLTVVGVLSDSEGVATVGAVGIVAALIIPRTKGPIEFGPSGFKSETWDELFEEVRVMGMARGLSADNATEVAAEQVRESVAAVAAQARDTIAALNVQRHAVWKESMSKALRLGAVDTAAELQEQIGKAVDEALRQKPGWLVRAEEIEQEPPYGRVDWMLETDRGPILIEAQFFTTGNYASLKRFAYERAVTRIKPYRAFLVGPGDGGPSEHDGVTSVGAGRLLDALLEL